jgi:hypothetical protein
MTVEALGRAVDLYRRTAASRSALVLIAANLFPLVGVLFFGWSLWTILVLYWLENGIVGFWNVPKILLAKGALLPSVVPPMPDDAALAAAGWNPTRAAELRAAWDEARAAQQRALDAADAAAATAAVRPPAGSGTQPMGVSAVHMFGDEVAGRAGAGGRAALAVFFLMHYGIFWFVHGIFVFLLPSFFGGAGAVECTPGDLTIDPNGFPIPLTDADCAGGFGTIVWSSVVIGAVALFLSHGASFLLNYVGRGEYLTTTPMRQMAAPYGRVVVLHLTIIFGAFAIAFIGAPIGALLILVVLKTALDLALHLRERRSAASPLPNWTA